MDVHLRDTARDRVPEVVLGKAAAAVHDERTLHRGVQLGDALKLEAGLRPVDAVRIPDRHRQRVDTRLRLKVDGLLDGRVPTVPVVSVLRQTHVTDLALDRRAEGMGDLRHLGRLRHVHRIVLRRGVVHHRRKALLQGFECLLEGKTVVVMNDDRH